jgi:hypothetical protein
MQKEYYDEGKKNRFFKEGDLLLVKNHAKTQWNQDMRVGPYRIEKVLKYDNYLLYDQCKKSWKKVNVEMLIAFNNRNIEVTSNDSECSSGLGDKGVTVIENREVKEKIAQEITYSPKQAIKKLTPVKSSSLSTKTPRVGDRIRVYWDKKVAGSEEKAGWYEGMIVKESDQIRYGSHEVLYDDLKEKGDLEAVYERLTSRTGNVRWEKLEQIDSIEKESESKGD